MKRFCGAILMGAVVMGAVPFTAYGASSGTDFARALRHNVVRVTASWKSGGSYEGFGFVVGARAGAFYVVTADHVVRGEGPDAIDRNPKVVFFGDKGTEYKAELLTTRFAPGEGDIAILRVNAPAGLAWRRDAVAGGRPRADTSVWFVGLGREWFVPSHPGSVNRIEPSGSIVTEGLNVRIGTSGAPLISDAGIVGMVVADTGTFARATPIDFIERAVKDWGYPWELTLVPDAKFKPASVPRPDQGRVPPPSSEHARVPDRVPPPPPEPERVPPRPDASAPMHDCDRLAANSRDPLKSVQADGVDIKEIDVGKALPACRQAVEHYPRTPRFAFQLARVYHAAGQFNDALLWYRRAAEAGSAMAQTNLGAIYANGSGGFARNDREAVRLYRLAAAQGIPRAQNSLGYMYETGRGGLIQDDVQAVRLYRLAAEQGLSVAQVNLARMYEGGFGGLAIDIDKALQLYERAAMQGNEVARRSIERLRSMQRPRMGVRWRSLPKKIDPLDSDSDEPAAQ